MVGDWKDWDADKNVKRPPELEEHDEVDYILRDGYRWRATVGELVWTMLPLDKRHCEIVKYRFVKRD